MSNFIKPPMLATSFSESAEKAKCRFENILNSKRKKRGMLALVLVVGVIITIGTLVACDNSRHYTNTAIVTSDCDLFSDNEGKEKIAALKKNDLVCIIYDENDDFYYIQLPALVSNASLTEGYIPSRNISFTFEAANQGVLNTGNIYDSPGDNNVSEKTYTYGEAFEIVKRKGEWTQINLRGADGKWVKAADISYDLMPRNIDLSYLNVQRSADNGHQPWRLNPYDVALDYLRNTLKLEAELKADENAENRRSKVFYYNNMQNQIVVYQPIKKDNTGIWVVNKATIMQGKISAFFAKDYQIVTNSGMGWRINIDKNTVYHLRETNLEIDIEDELNNIGIDVSKYYNKDIDILMYDVKLDGTTYPFVFAFDNTELIKGYNLLTAENAEKCKNLFISLEKGGNSNE